jgi:hypothetical protein
MYACRGTSDVFMFLAPMVFEGNYFLIQATVRRTEQM